MSWIIRGGRLIERGSAEDFATRPPGSGKAARSAFPCPGVVRDALDGVRSMQDGRRYDSKSALYRSYHEAGVRIVEKGEPTPALNPMSDMGAADVHAALGKVKAGYKPSLEMEDDG
jgi:hypothetical protein